MRTDGRTDMTKLIVAFRNFAKAPKRWPSLLAWLSVIICVIRWVGHVARLLIKKKYIYTQFNSDTLKRGTTRKPYARKRDNIKTILKETAWKLCIVCASGS